MLLRSRQAKNPNGTPCSNIWRIYSILTTVGFFNVQKSHLYPSFKTFSSGITSENLNEQILRVFKFGIFYFEPQNCPFPNLGIMKLLFLNVKPLLSTTPQCLSSGVTEKKTNWLMQTKVKKCWFLDPKKTYFSHFGRN